VYRGTRSKTLFCKIKFTITEPADEKSMGSYSYSLRTDVHTGSIYMTIEAGDGIT
jgi:hypothetical protein